MWYNGELAPAAPWGFHNEDLDVNTVKEIMREAGDGFATALILNQGSIKHVINVVNKNGEIYFIDTQMGKIVELNSNVKLDVGKP
ncbi:toxin glutamine deamidase domain-containing protein [Paenibacillus campi]|uniref:toxin glutamine deamidase domain-containing protein n=1 Tax=Paenibacillus campi TaxID=3106031 RepID=UPI003A4C7C00